MVYAEPRTRTGFHRTMPRLALIVGDACVDLILRISGGTDSPTTAAFPSLSGGGTSANSAVGLARLGVPTALVGVVGDDGYGRYVRSDLEREGVDTSGLVTDRDSFTGLVMAVIDHHGERILFGWPPSGGAHTRLNPSHVDRARIREACWLHTSGVSMAESPARDAALLSMSYAREANVPVSFDLNLGPALAGGAMSKDFLETIWRAVELSDYVLGSATDEIAQLLPGQSFEDGATELAGAHRSVVARLGAGGALLVSTTHRETISAFHVQVIDTLGAGDAFNAGFITACLEGRNQRTAVQWGNAAAALKIGRSGARGTPTRDELDLFFSKTRVAALEGPPR